MAFIFTPTLTEALNDINTNIETQKNKYDEQSKVIDSLNKKADKLENRLKVTIKGVISISIVCIFLVTCLIISAISILSIRKDIKELKYLKYQNKQLELQLEEETRNIDTLYDDVYNYYLDKK